MTDKNKERRELTVEDLKGISGGLIIDGGANYDSAVVDEMAAGKKPALTI